LKRSVVLRRNVPQRLGHATDEAQSELIYDGRSGAVDLDPFRPVRRSLSPGLPNMLQ
jgi:hypothetical protein